MQLAVDATQQILQKYTLLSLDDSKIDEEKAVEIENDVSTESVLLVSLFCEFAKKSLIFKNYFRCR